VEYGFTAVCVRDGDAITAYCEELPLTVAHGRTIDEALRALRDEVELTLIENRATTHHWFKGTRVLKREALVVRCRDPFDALR
jgi:hypothetical protein